MYSYEGFIPKSAEYIRHYAKENPSSAIMSVLSTVQAVLDVILEH